MCHSLGYDCITSHPGVQQLLQDAPLEIAYNSFLAYHGTVTYGHPFHLFITIMIELVDVSLPFLLAEEIFTQNPTEADQQKKKRFCAYRNLIFWFYPGIKRRERKPLSACLYAYIQARFPPTQNEEDFADHEFSKFTYYRN